MNHINLESIGLEESEAKVYKALLELGPSTVREITDKAGITRTLGYHVLEHLGLYGLVNRVSGTGKKIQYSANHPRSLVQFVKNKKNAWTRREEEVTELLSDLVSLYRDAEKPVVRYQFGIEGAKTMFWETLEAKTEIIGISAADAWEDFALRSWVNTYTAERARRRIHERLLVLDSEDVRQWVFKNYAGSKKYTSFRFISREQLPSILNFGGEINVFENKIVFAITRRPHEMGVMLESAPLVNIFKGLFELAWLQAVPSEEIRRQEVGKRRKK